MNKEKYLAELSALSAEGEDAVCLYNEISALAMRHIAPSPRPRCSAHYLSIEYLIGRMFYNNLMELGVLEETAAVLAGKGVDIGMFEEIEDAALGNGGLGRLAACYMDSGAATGIPLYGYGIRYRYGLFRQRFEDGFQKESPDDWLRFGDPWSIRREEERQIVHFADMDVVAVPYDMPVFGKRVNILRLYAAEGSETAQKIGDVLYPADDTREGKLLRIRQEYFLSAAAVGDILRAYEKRHGRDYSHFAEENAIQLNDTHPAFAVPELIRALKARGLPHRTALRIARQVFRYTNHTIMPEALECWDASLLRRILPDIAAILRALNNSAAYFRRKEGYSPEELSASALYDPARHSFSMANTAVYAATKINGVAEIHSRIIRSTLFGAEYAHHPEKFLNVTNGVTQRRWLELADGGLASLIDGCIGRGWREDFDRIAELGAFSGDEKTLACFVRVKEENKRRLFSYIASKEGAAFGEGRMLYAQVKRLHEYKRQLMTAFALLRLYFDLKEGKIDIFPSLFLFGAKSAPSYRRAKGIIKYINEIVRLINGDKETNGKLSAVFVSEYNVSYAEKIVAAADVSLQVSAAGTEASGTGNMKFMMNGAVTLGTADGANIEITARAGEENEYIFGARAKELENLRRGGYDPAAWIQKDPAWERVLRTLKDGTFSDGGTGLFAELYDSLTEGASWHAPDHYFIFRDIGEYYAAILRANADYGDRLAFARKQWNNIAASAYFSSDRAVREYAEKIWNIGGKDGREDENGA